MTNDENMNGQSSSRINRAMFGRPGVGGFRRPIHAGSGSGNSSSGTSTSADRKKAINAGLAGIPFRASCMLNNEMFNDNKVYKAAFESLPDRDFAYIASKTTTSFSNREIYVRGSGYENIYPGAILFVDEQITQGTPNPLGRVARNKISLYGDFLAGNNPSVPNVDPDNSSVRAATNKIMEMLLADSRYRAPGMQSVKTMIHTSQKSLMMELKVDSSFAGCSVDVNTDIESSSMSFVQSTTLEQDYFTVKLKDDWRHDPSSLFADSVTWAELSQVLRGNAIAIVTSVTYGRTFSYLKEFSAKKFKYDGSQHVTAYGQEVKSNQALEESSSCSKDEIFNLGGTALTIAALRSKKTQAELERAMADNMEFSRENQGVVTKYTIQLITGNSPGSVIRPLYSGTQQQLNYVRCPRRLDTHICVKDVHIGAGKVKVQLDVKCFRVVGNKKETTREINGSSSDKRQDPWWYTFDHSRNRVYGDCGEGEYIEPNPLLRIRAKTGGGSYSAKDEMVLSPKYLETGALNIELAGWVSGSVKIKRLEPITR